jgi:NADPH:quinone reductase-like Zn-dependent oxidoreductase
VAEPYRSGTACESLQPEALDIVDMPAPVRVEGRLLDEVSAAGVNVADTHHRLFRN